jgi:hypothetical protein
MFDLIEDMFDGGGIGILIVLIVAALALWLAIYVAKQFAQVALEKGHTGKRYFHLCFWLGIVGYLLVIALPDRKNLQ